MIENMKVIMENQNLSLKLKLLFNISLNKIESFDKNTFVEELPFELEEIISIQKLDNPYFLLFLYINKDKVHEELYDKEEILKIDFETKDQQISKYIYLCFLIEDINVMCDYKYSFELINKLNDIQRNEKEQALKKIILAKMIHSLVDNYSQIVDNEDNKNNKHEEELVKIYDFNSKILYDITNNTNLNQYGLKLEDLKSKKIEEIYLIIIEYLIQNSKLEDSDYIENIINQIELESIILTKLMLDELIKILTIEKEYIKKYEIKNFGDLFDKKIIYFYYNLLKYILKQSLYIYQFPFLLESRIKILDFIKNNLGELFISLKNSDYKYQIEYILKQFIGDNSYNYYNKKSESIINDSSTLNPFSRTSYKSEIQKSKRNILDEFGDYINDLEYILNESKFILHTNKKGEIPFIIYDEIIVIKNENEIENKTIEEIRKPTTDNVNDKLANNYKKFLSFLDQIESKLSSDFNNNYKLKITLNFETQNIKNDDFIITCFYDVEIPGENSEQFKDNNILTNGIGEGFQYMLNEINSSNYSNIEYL